MLILPSTLLCYQAKRPPIFCFQKCIHGEEVLSAKAAFTAASIKIEGLSHAMRPRRKDFKGCLQCRTRKVKCDGNKPHCENCRRIGKLCPGFNHALIWVPPNTEISKVQGRGGPPADSTWRSWSTLNFKEVEDRLVALDRPSHATLHDPTSVTSLFSVLDLGDTRHGMTQQLSKSQSKLCEPLNSANPDWSIQERSLLDHYVKHVAPQMMPLKDAANPWITHYASLAHECDSVRNALLSQAAAHLWNLQGRPSDMEIQILDYYTRALQQLRDMIAQGHARPFEEIVATILSLIMVDVYYGRSQGWKHHFSGAIQYACTLLPQKPWLKSEMAWLVAQSLCMLDLRTSIDGSTAILPDCSTKTGRETNSTSSFWESVDVRTDFGFTLGTSRALAKCLSECADLVATWRMHPESRSLHPKLDSLTQKLLEFVLSSATLLTPKQATQGRPTLQALNDHIFASGLLIRLNRQILGPWPKMLHHYAISALDGVERFMEYSNETTGVRTSHAVPTIWPVFHAAVELFRDHDQCRLRAVWLNKIEGAAIGNREQMRAVLEKVWSIRHQAAKDRVSELDASSSTSAAEEAAGEIAVDWMSVAKSMNIDLLLV